MPSGGAGDAGRRRAWSGGLSSSSPSREVTGALVRPAGRGRVRRTGGVPGRSDGDRVGAGLSRGFAARGAGTVVRGRRRGERDGALLGLRRR